MLETTCDAFAELLNRESGFEAMKNYVVEEEQEMRSDLLDMMVRYVEKGSER